MEEKNLKTSVSKPGDLSVAEINATVKAILEDTDVQDLLAKIGITKGQAYQDLSNKKFILPKKGEDEVGYAKRYIKFQVVIILMDKYNEKLLESGEEEVRKQAEKLAAQHATNLKRGDANAIIAMIESQGYLLSRDGKTAKKLTAKQKDIIVRKLKEGATSIEELLEEMEFEDEEPEVVQSAEQDAPEEEEEQNLNPEDFLVTAAMSQELEDDRVDAEKTDEPDREDFDDEEPDDTGVEEPDENKSDKEKDTVTMEDYNFRKATESEKGNILKQNQDVAENYRNVTIYISPENVSINEIANRIMKFQENNTSGERIVVSYFGVIIDPQKSQTVEQIIDDVKEKFKTDYDIDTVPDNTNDKAKIKEHITGVTHEILNDGKKVSEVAPVADNMRGDAKERDIVQIQEQEIIDEQDSKDDDEHPYPETR